MIDKSKIKEAKELFGIQVVNEVIEIVSISDADGAWSLFQDMNQTDHVECIEFLYFEDL